MLFENQLTGNLPIAISTCTKLVSLGLDYNNFEGSIPQEYSNLTLLTGLWLSANNLDGDITNIYASMPNLGGLFLHSNNLSGVIDLTMNENLEYAILSDNNLSTIDVRNGNNIGIGAIQALNNPNLTCVFVDDKNNIPSGWDIDSNATYVETQVECDALGIEEFHATTFKVYPNPTKDLFIINSETVIETVSIYDIFGKIVKTYPMQNEYDVSGITKGMYLINIKSETGTSVKKLIIE